MSYYKLSEKNRFIIRIQKHLLLYNSRESSLSRYNRLRYASIKTYKMNIFGLYDIIFTHSKDLSAGAYEEVKSKDKQIIKCCYVIKENKLPINIFVMNSLNCTAQLERNRRIKRGEQLAKLTKQVVPTERDLLYKYVCCYNFLYQWMKRNTSFYYLDLFFIDTYFYALFFKKYEDNARKKIKNIPPDNFEEFLMQKKGIGIR